MKTGNSKPMTPRQQKTTERGFTLMETSIAFLVMMVASLAVSSLFVFSMQNNVGGNERALAMAVAQQQFEQLRSVNFDDASLNVGTNKQTVRSGDRNYTVLKTVVDETNPNGSAKRLRRITITVTPQGGGPNWTRTPVTLVSYRSTISQGNYLVQ